MAVPRAEISGWSVVQLHPPLQAPADGDALQLMRELLDRLHFAALQSVQHQ